MTAVELNRAQWRREQFVCPKENSQYALIISVETSDDQVELNGAVIGFEDWI